jgi:recombination protein RecR
MNPISKLTELFSELPGLGPRQSKRIVYYLLTRSQSVLDDLAENITALKGHIKTCADCQRFFQKDTSNSNLCNICRDQHRDNSLLMVVSRDVDLDNIEKTRTYNGKYFVLGGSIPLMEKDPEEKIRSGALHNLMKRKSAELKEIILALNATPEGEHTADVLEKMIRPQIDQNAIKISRLGKGISTGTELEYSDGETIKNALRNRS